METKTITLHGKVFKLIRYKNNWVFPIIDTYEYGLGSPIAIMLYSYKNHEFDYYADITVNLPDCQRSAGCQFIDTNNNGDEIVDWLEENGFGKRTGNFETSGFCTYPEFNFYIGETFQEYKKLNDALGE